MKNDWHRQTSPRLTQTDIVIDIGIFLLLLFFLFNEKIFLIHNIDDVIIFQSFGDRAVRAR